MDDWKPTEEDEAPPPKKSKAWLWALLAVLVVAAGGYGVWRVVNAKRGQEATAELDAGAMEGDAGLASISEGDTLLKKLAASWSTSKAFLRWLEADDLLRRITAATNMVSEGDSPRPVLSFIEFNTPYAVTEKVEPGAKKKQAAKKKLAKASKRRGKNHKPPPEVRGKLTVSPESWARYDTITQAFTSVDAAAAGGAYGQLRPYFDAAFAEIGRPGKHFDDVLVAALDRIIGVKFPEGEVELVAKGAVYEYKDPALEGLTAAEKHLLRMGPTNGKAVQATLRRFAESAGLSLKAEASAPTP